MWHCSTRDDALREETAVVVKVARQDCCKYAVLHGSANILSFWIQKDRVKPQEKRGQNVNIIFCILLSFFCSIIFWLCFVYIMFFVYNWTKSTFTIYNWVVFVFLSEVIIKQHSGFDYQWCCCQCIWVFCGSEEMQTTTRPANFRRYVVSRMCNLLLLYKVVEERDIWVRRNILAARCDYLPWAIKQFTKVSRKGARPKCHERLMKMIIAAQSKHTGIGVCGVVMSFEVLHYLDEG